MSDQERLEALTRELDMINERVARRVEGGSLSRVELEAARNAAPDPPVTAEERAAPAQLSPFRLAVVQRVVQAEWRRARDELADRERAEQAEQAGTKPWAGPDVRGLELVSLAEAAAELGVSQARVRQLEAEGRFDRLGTPPTPRYVRRDLWRVLPSLNAEKLHAAEMRRQYEAQEAAAAREREQREQQERREAEARARAERERRRPARAVDSVTNLPKPAFSHNDFPGGISPDSTCGSDPGLLRPSGPSSTRDPGGRPRSSSPSRAALRMRRLRERERQRRTDGAA